ncbi:hypothetical protein BKA93DRAFT_763979 [Sparassis latifolia]|uniref:Uncharacterized protein n=1 Tax=Sparassis crispa TaxID=139825 RepID=A0A401GKT7_9APHY|nr:hypothetical protein SCP_0411390 [Sparassis crispa]GBE82754.1 hypothetical protein SCP_0411390 [Sparassis crispa]
MISLLLAPIVEVYRFALTPIAPFTWFGLSFSTLDVAAAVRLCVALRQLREKHYQDHVQKVSDADKNSHPQIERRSWLRDVSATLMVVYGGEAVTAPALGIPPSFMISGAVPAFYAVIQALVDSIPSILYPTLYTELPVSILDGFSRAFLLCTFIPPMVLQHSWKSVSTSPWSLLLTSLATANGGFFFINLFSFLHPYALTLTTPAELLPYGWTTADLWCAPLITGLYALLTHAQPFWANVHAAAAGALGAPGPSADPVDPEVARALCAAVLATVFAARTYRTYGVPPAKVGVKLTGEKTKVQ